MKGVLTNQDVGDDLPHQHSSLLLFISQPKIPLENCC